MQNSKGLATILTYAILALTNTSCSNAKENKMSNEILSVKASCVNNPECYYDGNNIKIEIEIKNVSSSTVGFPLEFRQKTGPFIKLQSSKTKASYNLRTNLADLGLKHKFTQILPGKSVKLNWEIGNKEIEFLGKDMVDIYAEISTYSDIEANGKILVNDSIDTLHITSKPKNTSQDSTIGDHVRLSCEAGNLCPKDGYWFTPAKVDSRRVFKQGEIMPSFANEYGLVIWQWDGEA